MDAEYCLRGVLEGATPLANLNSTIDADEVARFNRLSETWWDRAGPMRPLHAVNDLRIGYVRDRIATHFGRAVATDLRGLRILDVGCGAGLLSEELAALGATVVGIDPTSRNIEAARIHAARRPELRAPEYRVGDLSASPDSERFDVVLLLEVVEHVDNLPLFIAAAASRVDAGGMIIASTINRTAKSFLLAIVGAEYVLRLLPRGTHRWRKFVKPHELVDPLSQVGFSTFDLMGMHYRPFAHVATWERSTSVNYIAAFARQDLDNVPTDMSTSEVRDLRSDHAGEVGAVAIYRGILDVSRDSEVRSFAIDHLATERQHLEKLELVLPHNQRSALAKLWRLAGYLTGAMPALFGRRAFYHTIAAVETFVDHHYAKQINRLPSSGAMHELRALLESCRRDEVNHRDQAIRALGCRPGWLANLWTRIVGAGLAAAVALARRL